MNNLGNNQFSKDNIASEKKNVVNERFEQNAGVKIHKGKESYSGGSGYYAPKSKGCCPNVNDSHNDQGSGNDSNSSK